MDVVLINSPLFKDTKVNHNVDDYLPPIGLGYIATNLKINNISCTLIDAVSENISFDTLLQELNRVKPVFIGINIFSTNFIITKEIIEFISFKTTFIVGGNAVQFLHKEIFDFITSNEIFVVIGDGELITVDIVQFKLKEDPIAARENRFLYRVDNHSVYFPKNISNMQLDRSFFRNEPTQNKIYNLKEAAIVTSRGCIYNCAFCGAARKLNKHSDVRERNIESVINEINYLENLYNSLESIRILDDLFLKNNQNIEKASNIFLQKQNLKWRAMAHTMSFSKSTQEDINKLYQSGCYELSIGIESGSEEILKMIHKLSTISTIVNTFEKIFKAGINVKGYFIYGFPNENIDDAEKTFILASKLKDLANKYNTKFRTSVFQFRPYHGTELYNSLSQENLLYQETVEDYQLSETIGRTQFNFTSGNYSNITQSDLNDYIKRTLELNN
ncbi:MAG: radical SAM protein [Thiovulaceae bacterium]|nr:radical SAM protein [Sulfurimonadaceae bacterium]